MHLIEHIGRRRGWRALSVGLMLLLIGGCGWQLQGTRRVSAKLMPMYMQQIDAHSDFSAALRQRLRLAGVTVTEDASAAQTTLHIVKDESGHRIISVSATNTPLEYEVYYNVNVEVRSQSGDMLLQQPLSATHSYTYSESAALAKQREELILTETMAGELADQIMRQIRTL